MSFCGLKKEDTEKNLHIQILVRGDTEASLHIAELTNCIHQGNRYGIKQRLLPRGLTSVACIRRQRRTTTAGSVKAKEGKPRC
jgi:hypothetical protein